MIELRALQEKVALLWPHLDERARRLFAASEARQLGHGGVSLVSRACGLSRVTITKGLHELDDPPLTAGRVRRVGGGRPALVALDPDLPTRLEALVEPLTRGDPESPLRWTSKSTRALSAELAASAIRSAMRRSRSCCARWTTACRAIGKRKRATIIRTGMRSFSTSMSRYEKRSRRGAPSSRWTRRRRRFSATITNDGQQWRPAQVSATGEGPRLPGPVRAACVSVRHLRHRAQHGIRECRHRP